MNWSEMIGRHLGDYEIVAELGHGGAAHVFRARVRSTGQTVAIKVIPNDAEDHDLFVRRFALEIEVVRALHHENIVAVYDAGETEELVYLVMQCVEGGTLRQRMAHGRPDQFQVISYAIQMARALHHAHQRGVVHRDVKPSNMLLDADRPDHVLLADFGIAKIQGLRGITRSGTTLGTPEYMSPEQAENRESDPRSDIYSLGCVVYEMLTGRPPFVAAHSSSVLYQHVHRHPAYIRGYNPAVPKQLCRVVEIALAKNPDARFPTAEHFARALAPFMEPGYQGVSSEPLNQATLPPIAVVAPPMHHTADQPTQPLASERPASARIAAEPAARERVAHEDTVPLRTAPESGPLGPWSLQVGEQSTRVDERVDERVDDIEETIRLGAMGHDPGAAQQDVRVLGNAGSGGAEPGARAASEQARHPAPTTDPLTAPSLSPHPSGDSGSTAGNAPDAPRMRATSRPATIRAMFPDLPVAPTAVQGETVTATAAPADATALATRDAPPASPRPESPRPAPAAVATRVRATSRPISGPAAAAEEASLWPKTILETGAPALRNAGRKRARRGRPVRAALSIAAMLALLLAASLVASAMGIVTLPGPRADTALPGPTLAPTATQVPATATTSATTPAADPQQVANQRAYNSFRAATLGLGPDAACATSNATSSFPSGTRIFINLCAAGNVAASGVSVIVRQTGDIVCTQVVQAGKNYDCYSDYALAPGHYDMLVTMKVNGTQATARDLHFTVTA